MAKVVQHRRGTVTEWQSYQTLIPLEGELVVEMDDTTSACKVKIGNGINIRNSTKLNKLFINDNIIGNLTLDFAGATTSNITNFTNLYSVKNNFKLSNLSEYILV